MHQHSGYNRPVSLKGHVYYSRSQAVVEIVRGFEVWFSPGFITQYFLKFLETPSMRIPGKLGFPEFSNTACNVQEDPENGRWPSSAFSGDRWHITWDKVKLRHTTNTTSGKHLQCTKQCLGQLHIIPFFCVLTVLALDIAGNYRKTRETPSELTEQLPLPSYEGVHFQNCVLVLYNLTLQ